MVLDHSAQVCIVTADFRHITCYQLNVIVKKIKLIFYKSCKCKRVYWISLPVFRVAFAWLLALVQRSAMSVCPCKGPDYTSINRLHRQQRWTWDIYWVFLSWPHGPSVQQPDKWETRCLKDKRFSWRTMVYLSTLKEEPQMSFFIV